MEIKLHKLARTTPATRQYIQPSGKRAAALSQELGVWQRADEWMAKGIMLTVGIGLSMTGYVGIQALFRSQELDVLWRMVQQNIPFLRPQA